MRSAEHLMTEGRPEEFMSKSCCKIKSVTLFLESPAKYHNYSGADLGQGCSGVYPPPSNGDKPSNEQTNGGSSIKFPGCLVIFTSLLCMAKSNMETTMYINLLRYLLLNFFFFCMSPKQQNNLYWQIKASCVTHVSQSIASQGTTILMNFCIKLHDFCVNTTPGTELFLSQ